MSQNTFWNHIDVSMKIDTIDANSIENATHKAYSTTHKYNFYLNSELIDIKNRFRIFNYKNKTYISKIMDMRKADVEISNSQKAKKYLEGQIINKRKIKIIIPQKIILEKKCFLVSEYRGHTLHESLYSHNSIDFSLEECFEILNKLLSLKMVHHGFLQRNIIVNKENIFLFDWEDASFENDLGFNSLWQTLFILNWSYTFDINDIYKNIHKLKQTYPSSNEPNLLNYEKDFINIINVDISNYNLRKIIEEIAFKAELPINIENNYFYIHPHDMGHLIADTFPSDLGFLYDIIASTLRIEDEKKFAYILQILTKFYILYYNEQYTYNSYNIYSSLQYYILIPFIMLLEKNISEQLFKDILSVKDINKALVSIKNNTSKTSLTNAYINQDIDKHIKKLDRTIKAEIAATTPETSLANIKNTEHIVEYIINTSHHR